MTFPRIVFDIFIIDQEKMSGKIWTAIPRMTVKASFAEAMRTQPASSEAPKRRLNMG